MSSNGIPSNRSLLNWVSFGASSIFLLIALLGGGRVGYGILTDGMGNQISLTARILVISLSYIIGWIIGLFGMRKLDNKYLPYVIQIYAWLTVFGLAILQFAIMTRLYRQNYTAQKFVMYLFMYGCGLLALIGLHLLVENHSLVPLSFPILFASLTHLITIVSHYVFVMEGQVINYKYLTGDVVFFFITFGIGVLMLAHLGVLSTFRNTISKKFSENTEPLVPLD
jgi:hypothetical protein